MKQPIDKAGGILLRQTPHGGHDLYLVFRPQYHDWSPPKGHCDVGETLAEAALREVREETGFVCHITKKLPIYQYTTPQHDDVRVHWFLMECDTQSPSTHHDDEVAEGQWIPLAEALQKISYPTLAAYIQKWYTKEY